LAVETGVVVIVVAGAVVAVVLIAALSMRGRQKRRGAARRAERDRDGARTAIAGFAHRGAAMRSTLAARRVGRRACAAHSRSSGPRAPGKGVDRLGSAW
jgi:hypothetical protein